MQEFYTLVTDVGGAAIANATILGQKVSITNFAVGDGAGNYYTPTSKMTELKREVWRGKPTSVEIDPQNANIMVISTVIPAEIGGFTIREMGLFSEDGKLIAVSNCPDLQKVTLDTGVASELALTMQIAVSNTETIEFKVDPTVIIATKADVEDVKKEIENPEFDDSGTTEGINSFTDFMAKVKSKMNIFEFFKNFKAGMKFILHTGMIVDNYATKEKGFLPDATLVTSLKEQLDEQNKNINGREIMKHLPFNGTDLNTINIDDASGNFVAGFTNDVTEGTFPNKSWQNIVQFDTYHFRSQFSVTSDGRGGHPKPAIRSWWGSVWSDWYSLVTNSDLPIFETFIPTFNNTDTVAITLQHKVIDGGHIFVTNGDFVACPVPIVGIRLPDGDRTNKVEVRFASNIVGVARINILYKPYYS